VNLVEISVFCQDRVGRLAEISGTLGEAGLNIRGFHISDTAEGYGIFRVITQDQDKALEVLTERGFSVSQTEVICVDVPDEPGGIARVLDCLSDADVNVGYLYAIVNSLIVFHVDKPAAAAEALRRAGVRVLTSAEVYSQ